MLGALLKAAVAGAARLRDHLRFGPLVVEGALSWCLRSGQRDLMNGLILFSLNDLVTLPLIHARQQALIAVALVLDQEAAGHGLVFGNERLLLVLLLSTLEDDLGIDEFIRAL